MPHSLTVLVTGATGKQGGALAHRLLANGHRVHALTRNSGSPAAQELQARGARLVAGGFDDPASIQAAMQGVDAVFAMSTPYEAGVEAETRQGIALADAARAGGVRHFVYTSVASADRNTGIPHFDSKLRVERHIAALEIPHTILGPAFFMENFTSPWWLPAIRQGALPIALPPDRALQQIAVENIGTFAAIVIERRDLFVGKRIDLASDECSGRDVARILSAAMGRPIEYREIPVETVRRQSEDFGLMFEWFDRVGYTIDIEGLRRDYPEVGWLRLAEWAERQDWAETD